MIGHVVHWNRIRGFGKLRGAGEEFFVHKSELIGVVGLRVGQLVTFDPTNIGRGPRAVRVCPCETDDKETS